MGNALLSQTIQLLRSDAWRMECLHAVASQHLPDWYISAGFLRNAIWDHLHDKCERTSLNDVDVVYFDRDVYYHEVSEKQTEKSLQNSIPGVPWSVKNQARMHLLYADRDPYVDSDDGIAHFIETPTCVGVKLDGNGDIVIVAPFGITENWSLRVAPNPRIPLTSKYGERIREKKWLQLWPKLKINWAGQSIQE